METDFIDELVTMIVENDLKLNNEMLKAKVEEIEAYSNFYNQNTYEAEYKEIMRIS